jgi:predicted subunit of tRNA(5-methylaminomethyl-2-thiouridylate) methyltransferase
MRPVYTGECIPALSPEAREARLKHQTIEITLALVEHAVAVVLRREAARRETTLDYLVRSVLDVVARDKLTGAILDDGREGRTRPSGALL